MQNLVYLQKGSPLAMNSRRQFTELLAGKKIYPKSCLHSESSGSPENPDEPRLVLSPQASTNNGLMETRINVHLLGLSYPKHFLSAGQNSPLTTTGSHDLPFHLGSVHISSGIQEIPGSPISSHLDCCSHSCDDVCVRETLSEFI